MITSEKRKKRMLFRKTKRKDRLTTTKINVTSEGLFGDKVNEEHLFFAEYNRKARQVSNFLLMTTRILPITEWKEEGSFDDVMFLKQDRFVDNGKRLMAYQDRIKAESDKRLAAIVDEFEQELIAANEADEMAKKDASVTKPDGSSSTIDIYPGQDMARTFEV